MSGRRYAWPIVDRRAVVIGPNCRRFIRALARGSAVTLLGWQALALAQTDDATIDEVFGRLSAVETVRGEFVQSREISALSNPLRSSGHFIVSELGLYWEQREPFPTVLIAREDSISEQIGGQPRTTVSASQSPISASISRIFLGLFSGDLGKLEEVFRVGFEGSNERWTLSLEPRSYPLTEAIEAVTVSGSDYMESIQVDGLAGDRMTIELLDQSAEPAVLSLQERELYFP